MWQTTRTRNCLQTGRHSDLQMTQIIFRQFGTSLFVTLTLASQLHSVNMEYFPVLERGTKQRAFLDCSPTPRTARIRSLLSSFTFGDLPWWAHDHGKIHSGLGIFVPRDTRLLYAPSGSSKSLENVVLEIPFFDKNVPFSSSGLKARWRRLFCERWDLLSQSRGLTLPRKRICHGAAIPAMPQNMVRAVAGAARVLREMQEWEFYF